MTLCGAMLFMHKDWTAKLMLNANAILESTGKKQFFMLMLILILNKIMLTRLLISETLC